MKSGAGTVKIAAKRFKGENAKLAVKGYIRNRLSSEQAVTFSFVIPEGGFASAPIVKSGSNADYPLFAKENASSGGVTFRVEKASPYLKARGNFTQPLVDWTRNGTSYQIDTAGVAFAAMPRDKERMYFTPESGDTKSGIAVDCKGRQGLAMIIR